MNSIDKWFVFYSQFKHEKKIHDSLLKGGFDSYLPVVKSLREWSDRKKWVEEPMFPCYNFVKVEENHLFEILKISGVVKIVSFGRERAFLDADTIQKINKIINHQHEIEIKGEEQLSKGDRVKIVSGNFKGMNGSIVTLKNGKRLILLLDLFGVSVTVSFDSVTLEKIV